VPGDGQEHGTSCAQQFITDLAARRPAAHDKHGAVRQILGAAVARRVGLQHGRRNALGQVGNPWLLEGASRDDDATGVDRPARYGEHEPMVVSTQLGGLSVLPNRRLVARRLESPEPVTARGMLGSATFSRQRPPTSPSGLPNQSS